MNRLAYYKAYPRDFLEGTIGMALKLKGAYRILLDLIYMHGGMLVDDPRFISGHLGCSPRKWKSLRNELVAQGKLTLVDGHLGNKRADIELEKLADFQKKQSNRAHRVNNNNELREPRQGHPESETEIDDHDPRVPTPPRDRLLEAMGVPSSTGRSGDDFCSLGNPGDMEIALKWKDELDITTEEQISVIRRVMGNKRDGPPNSFKYFEKEMRNFSDLKHCNVRSQKVPRKKSDASKSSSYGELPRSSWKRIALPSGAIEDEEPRTPATAEQARAIMAEHGYGGSTIASDVPAEHAVRSATSEKGRE